MPLPSSGQLSLLQIRNYYKKTGAISLSQLYRGGGIVPDIPEYEKLFMSAFKEIKSSSDIEINHIVNAISSFII